MSSTTLEVVPIPIAGQRPIGDEPFPRVLENRTSAATLHDTVRWLEANRDALKKHVEKCGAILFRSFPVYTAENFDQFVAAFGWENFPYEESLSNAVRVNKTPRVF